MLVEPSITDWDLNIADSDIHALEQCIGRWDETVHTIEFECDIRFMGIQEKFTRFDIDIHGSII